MSPYAAVETTLSATLEMTKATAYISSCSASLANFCTPTPAMHVTLPTTMYGVLLLPLHIPLMAVSLLSERNPVNGPTSCVTPAKAMSVATVSVLLHGFMRSASFGNVIMAYVESNSEYANANDVIPKSFEVGANGKEDDGKEPGKPMLPPPPPEDA